MARSDRFGARQWRKSGACRAFDGEPRRFVKAQIHPQLQGFGDNREWLSICETCRRSAQFRASFPRPNRFAPSDDRVGTLREMESNRPVPSSKRLTASSNRLAFTFHGASARGASCTEGNPFRRSTLKMKMRVLLVCASMLLIAARKKVPATPPPPTVQLTELLQQDVPIYRDWVGTLDGFVNADIKPQVAGYIQKQAYQEGSFVRQGAVLFLIEPRN